MIDVLVELRVSRVELGLSRVALTLLPALTLLLALAGCGADAPRAPAPTSSSAPPVAGENLIPQILGHVWRADLSRDGRLAVMAGDDEAAIVDVATDDVLALVPGCATDAAFAPDGRHVVVLGCAGIVHVWDLARDRIIDVGGSDVPNRLERGGPFILARSEDSVEIVHVAPPRRTRVDLGEGKVKRAFALANGGVAVWQEDGLLRVFRATGAQQSSAKVHARGRVVADAGAHSLLFTDQDRAVVVDVLTGYVIGSGTPCGSEIEDATFTKEGARVALRCAGGRPGVVSVDPELRLFLLDLTRVPGGEADARAVLRRPDMAPPPQRSERAADIRVARGGKLSVTTPESFVLDTATGLVARGATLTESEAPSSVVAEPPGWTFVVRAVEGSRHVSLDPTAACATVSADGAISASVTALASAGRPARVRIDRLGEAGAFDVLQTAEALGGCSLALSSDGRFLLAGRAVFDTRSRTELWAMAPDDVTLTFLPGGRLAFANVPGRSRIIDAASGVEQRALEGMAVLHGSSDDGRYVVLSRDHRLVLVDGDTGRVAKLPFEAAHQVVWVSAGGAIVWIGTSAGLEAYRVADGARLRWIGGRGPVTEDLMFDPAAGDLPLRVRRGSNILTAKAEPLGESSARAHPRLYSDFVAGKRVSPAP